MIGYKKGYETYREGRKQSAVKSFLNRNI